MFLRKQLISCQIRAQIRLLLKRSSNHSISAASLSPSLPHRVLVRDSTIPGAGQGVFSQHSAKPGTVLCLYPGVHTPALPTTVDDDSFLYLANQITPSGSPPCENAYILNLHSIGGGYLDGAALRVGNRILDANPNACAHFVNHSVKRANVNVLSLLGRTSLHHTSRHRSTNNHSTRSRTKFVPTTPPGITMPEPTKWFCSTEESDQTLALLFALQNRSLYTKNYS